MTDDDAIGRMWAAAMGWLDEPVTDGPPYMHRMSPCQDCEDEVDHEHLSFTVVDDEAAAPQ